MLRFLVRLNSILIVVFLVLSIVVYKLGTSQSPNPTLAGFREGCKDKPQPCWYGIVPGVTNVEEAIAILKRVPIAYQIYSGDSLYPADDVAPCSAILEQDESPNALVLSIRLEGCQEDLRLETVIGTLGSPSSIDSCVLFGSQVGSKALPKDDHLQSLYLAEYEMWFSNNWNTYRWNNTSFDQQYLKFDPVEITTIACGEG